MYKFLLVSSVFLSVNAFSQTPERPDPDSQINAEEQIHGLPGNSPGKVYSIRTKKRTVKVHSTIAPVENHAPANCADNLGGKGSATFTACEAVKKTR